MKRRIIWINAGLALLLVAVAAGGYFLLFAPKEATLTGRTVAVQQGTISETVTATGTVETAGAVELSFGQAGTVDGVYVAEGDTIRKGRKVAALDSSSARQAVTNARSSYVQAVASASQSGLSLESARQGVTDAEHNATLNKAGYADSVQTARRNLADATSSWSDACLDPNGTCPDAEAWAQLRASEADVSSAKTAYDQAVQTASAQETANNLKLNQTSVNVQDAQAKQDTACNTYGSDSTQCTTAVSSLKGLQQQYELLVNSNQTAALQSQQSLVNADARVTQANISLRKLQASLQKQSSDSVTAAQDALDQALQAQRKGLAADQQSVTKAKEALASAQASGAAVSTPAGSMTTSQAQVDVAKAGLAVAAQNLAGTVLRSSVAGTVASVDVAKGDAATAGTTVATVLPASAYEIVADFSEADAMKVAVGQKAAVTFDALPDVTATGTVTSVEILPTDSTSSGAAAGGTTSSVTTYAATITLDDVSGDIREGMSASVVVTTDEATNVLWVPTAAVTTAGGQSTVTVRTNGVDTVTQVTTGLAGDSGIEITDGLTSGDQVVVTTTGSSTSTGGFPMGGIPGGGVGGPPAGGGRG
jgi:membrane fusion protein, macrolide-specific efflux system